MMRKLFVLAVVGAMVGFGGLVHDARAGSTVDLLFTGVNGGSIAATNQVTVAGPGDTLTMHAFMRTDQPLGIAFFSINYDLALENEFDVVSAFQWNTGVAIAKNGTDFWKPISAVPNPLTSNFSAVETMEGATIIVGKALPGNAAVSYQMGTVVWKVNAPLSDGVDIISGLLTLGVDGWYDSTFTAVNPLTLVFNGATVNVVPEPGTASLLGLGLVGLVLAGRRSRS